MAVRGPELIAGGNFGSAAGLSASHIAQWDGSAWHNLGSGTNENVYALAVHGAGAAAQLVVGGTFTEAGEDVSAYLARYGPSCPPGDVDQDGSVGIVDMLALLASWGPCPQPCPPACAADFDGDCNVGILDFLLLLANWS